MYQSLSPAKASGSATRCWLPLVSTGADMMTTRLGRPDLGAACGERAAGGGVSTVVSKRMGLRGDTCL
jgi:hypothetical protein